MSDRDALVAATIAHPDEDTPRLVLADWLDEHGEPERAEFIRVQIEIARMVIVEPSQMSRYYELRRRESELRVRHIKEWERAAMTGLPANRQTLFWFTRGCPEVLICTPNYFRTHGPRVVATAPLRQLRPTRPTPRGVGEIVDSPAFRSLSGFRIEADANVNTTACVRELLTGPLSHLRTLALSSNVSYASPPPVEWAGRSAAAVEMIAACEQLSGLRRLTLTHALIGEAGVRALAASVPLRNIPILVLTGNHLSEEQQKLLRSRFGSRVYLDYPDYRGRLTNYDIE